MLVAEPQMHVLQAAVCRHFDAALAFHDATTTSAAASAVAADVVVADRRRWGSWVAAASRQLRAGAPR